MHQICFTVLGNVDLLLHNRLGKSSPMQKDPTQFLPHTVVADGSSQCTGCLESTEMNTAEVITQVRKHIWKDMLVFFCLGINYNLN